MNYYKQERPLPGSVIVVLFLISCSSLPERPPFAPVYVTDRARFTLLPAMELEEALDGPQQFSGTFGAQTFVMDAWVQADTKGINMIFFNSMGADMGNFSFTDEQVSFHSPVFPASLKAEYLAADFQFCFYRPAALRDALRACGLAFEIAVIADENGEAREVRTIIEGNTAIIRIEKTGTQTRYQNFLRGYSYTIMGGGGAE